MEDLIEQTGCGSKSESIMMRILRSSMDRAQEKLQLKDKRQIEFLHEQTTFYQLAAILVEGSIKILEEEDESEILESSCSKMISDLIEIREGLEGRIRDMKRLIMEKDREFRERLDNELRLREALELTERESIQLYEKIGPVIMMMKDSVDEQVLDIKQKLEDEKMILDSEIRARTWHGYSPNLMPGSLNNGQGSVVLLEDEKMILNTEKRARRSLSSPNLSYDILDSERRARRSHSNPNLNSMMILNVERRAKRSHASSPNLSPSSLNKKLFKELELVTFEDEKMILNTGSRARRLGASSPNPNPDSLDKERGLVPMEDDQFMSSGIDILKQTLDLVFGRVQLEEVVPLEKQLRKGIKREVDSILVKGFARDIQTKFDIELKKRDGLVKGSWFDFIDEMKSLFHELKDFFSRNDVSNVQPCFPKSRRTNSEPNLDFDFTQNLLENNGDEVGGSHHVWKIIKSHESIIQRQREQRSLLARDTLQREGTSSWIKRNEDINAMERLIQDVIVRLENFTQRKHKVSDLKGVGCRSRSQERRGRVPKPHRVMDRTSTTIQSFEAEIKKLQEERDGLCFQIAVIEDTYQLLFRGVMKDFSCCGAKETASDELEGSNRHRIQIHYMESAIREDIFALIFEEMVKQWEMSLSDLARGPKVPQEDSRDSPILQDYIESLLREDLYKIYIREMAEEWRLEALKLFDFEVRMPQPRVTFQEEIEKELKIRSQSDPARDSKTPQEDSHFSSIQDCTECLLREEIFKTYFRETTEAWRSEALAQFNFNFEAHTPQSRVMFQEENWKMSQSGSVRCSKTPQEDLHCGPVQDCTECLLRDEIYQIYFKETTKAWRSEALKQFDFEARSPQSRVMSPHETPQEAFRLSPILEDYVESLLREEIHKIYFKEMTKAWSSQVLNHFDFEAPTPQSRRSSKTETTLQEETPKQWKPNQSNSARISKTPQEDFRCSPAEECMKCLLREEVYMIYLTEMIKSWRSSQESKHTDFEARTPQSRRAQACLEGTPRSATPRSRGGDGESSLIHKVDSLLKSLELEENLMLTASSLIKEHSVSNSLVILDCEETEERAAIEWLITDDESTFCSVSEKLERALQQLHTTKELLAELEESLEVSDDGGEYYENSEFNNILRLQDESTSPCLGLQGVGETDWSENVLEIVKRFRFLVDDVEVELYENLEGKCLRLEALKHQVDALTQPVAWIKTRKLLYEKAFISRCGNLKLAEIEVDLLGDQVETLLSLLERIYQVLSRDARVLSTYFEVYDILKLIKIELNGGRSSIPKSQIADLSSISPKSLPASTIRQHSIFLRDGNPRLASNHIF